MGEAGARGRTITASRRAALLVAAAALAGSGASLLARSGPDAAHGAGPAGVRAALPPWAGGPDTDGDGVADGSDALPFLASESVDTDADGYGDAQDRFPDDPERGRPAELFVGRGFELDAGGWTARPDADAPRWTSDEIPLASNAAVLHVAGRVGASGAARPRLHLEVRNRDPVGTHTVERDVPLEAAPDGARDGWRTFEAAVELPSRPVSVRLVASVLETPDGIPAAAAFDGLSAHAVTDGDVDDDGIADARDPDDDGDGFLDGEDPAPLDASTGPVGIAGSAP